MGKDYCPLRWPTVWKNPDMLSLLQVTPIRHLLTDPETVVPGLADQAKQAGFTLLAPAALPEGVTVVKGLWPGVRLSRRGGDRAAAGPTGEPWVDSNGWRIRAAKAIHPEAQIWVEAKPQPSRTSIGNYISAFADAAADGGRWIVELDDVLAADIAAKKPEAVTHWQKIAAATGFFATDQAAPTDRDQAVIGVLSTFAGPKVGFTDEVLNNLARTKQQYRPIAAGRMTPASFDGLNAVIYTDASEPDANVRKLVLQFVSAGGMLITGSAWGALPKETPGGERTHPRFAIRAAGKGWIALASTPFTDPYMVANDAVVLVSHRNDVVRFFNAGAITPCLTVSPDQRRAALRIVFYSLRPIDDASVWIKGSYRTARLRTWNQQQAQNIKLQPRDAGVEVFLPAVSQYAVIELES